MTTTLNGWPYPAAKLVTKMVPGTNRKMTLNADCAALLLAVAADYHATVRPIDQGAVDDAGFCDRDARAAAGQKSNHANGSAADLNWSQEGAQNSSWGQKFFAQAKIKLAIAAMKQRYGSCVQWGGDWNKYKDYMHWEIKPGVTVAQVKALCAKLGIDENGVRSGKV